LRILWVSQVVPYPPKAGVLLRAYHLLKGVASRHEVDLFAFVQEPWLRTFFPDRDSGLEECRTELLRFCRNVHFAPIERLARRGGQMRTAFEALFETDCYMAGWLRGDFATKALAALAAQRAYDLVHFDTISLARYRPLFAGAPATLGHHNIESAMLQRRAENESNLLKRWYFQREGQRLRSFEQQTSGQFIAHITCSEIDSERLRALAPVACTIVIPNGVDCEYFRPEGLPKRADSLIFVGTMNWYPNVAAIMFLLRDVWPAVRRARPTATLDVVGANAPDSVRKLAIRTPGVKLLGFVPEVRPLMETAALYVCPIRDGGGTKLKILDACSMSCCVVAHPIACEGIDVEHGTHVVLAATADEMAAEIIRLFDDAPTRTRIGLAARALMQQRYSFSAIGATLARSFTEITAQNPA
jgi:polysaccharide biosynthesis protein PslH